MAPRRSHPLPKHCDTYDSKKVPGPALHPSTMIHMALRRSPSHTLCPSTMIHMASRRSPGHTPCPSTMIHMASRRFPDPALCPNTMIHMAPRRFPNPALCPSTMPCLWDKGTATGGYIFVRHTQDPFHPNSKKLVTIKLPKAHSHPVPRC